MRTGTGRSHLRRSVAASGAAWAFASAVCAADDMQAQLEELQRQNEVLAAKVARLDGELEEQRLRKDGWLTDARVAQIRDLVADVLADSDTRASLRSDGATAGWNKGFFIGSADGSFRLNIKGEIQTRWAYNHREIPGGPLATGSATGARDNWGWELRRTRLTFAGHVLDPSLSFEVKLSYERSTGSVSGLPPGSAVNFNNINGSIQNIWIQKSFDGGWAVRLGQFKSPFVREELVSSTSQLAVERSLVSEVFTTQYSQGLQVEFAQDRFRVQGYYGDGQRANAVNPTTGAGVASGYAGGFNNAFGANETNYSFAGRAELLVAGTWSQFRDFTSYRGEEFGLMFGIAGMAQSLRPTSSVAASAAQEMWGITGDVSIDFGGANLYAYGVYRGVTLKSPTATRGGGTNDSLGQYGFVVQGGFFIVDEVELYARYEYGDTDTDQYRTAASASGADLDKDSILTVGANWYPMGSRNKDLKFTADVGYAFTPIGDFASSGADWLSDATPAGGASERGQWVVRAQFQLLF